MRSPLLAALVLASTASALQTPPEAPKPAPKPEDALDHPENRLTEWQRRAKLDALPAVPSRELSAAEADGRLRAAFAALDEKERKEVLDWFESECAKLGTFQQSLVAWVTANQDRHPSAWPELQPLAWFDPAKHADKQPIPRTPLDPAAKEVAAVRNRLLAAPEPRRAVSGWKYDYATRSLVRLPHQGTGTDKRRVFDNALLGLPPGWDLVEAWVEKALDDGSLAKSFAAFGHAYTDRTGGVYAGVTLYDAHAARTEIEMPDVDTLGLVHELLGDWSTWKSVVHESQHAELFAKIGELFQPVHRHRGLRENLARAYLVGNAELRDQYQANLVNFHAMWELASSDPTRLAPTLPDSAKWAEYLQRFGDKVANEPELALKAFRRQRQLDLDAKRVRETIVWVMDQYGAIARVEPVPEYR